MRPDLKVAVVFDKTRHILYAFPKHRALSGVRHVDKIPFAVYGRIVSVKYNSIDSAVASTLAHKIGHRIFRVDPDDDFSNKFHFIY